MTVLDFSPDLAFTLFLVGCVVSVLLMAFSPKK